MNRSVALLYAAILWVMPSISHGEERVLGLELPDSTKNALSDFVSRNKYALVVGINSYDNASQGITNLKFAVGDARMVYSTLVDPRRGGFRPENVILLTDDTHEKPTSKNIGISLNTLASRADTTDLVVMFFSGHGYEDGGRSYLLTSNADLSALDYTALERDVFNRQLDRFAARKMVVILDACHSGGVNRDGKGVGRDAVLSAQYYERFMGSRGRVLMASSAGGELSYEDLEGGHGVFTSALVAGLGGDADVQPRDGIVSLSEIKRHVETSVTNWAASHRKSQHPQVNLENSFGDIPVALNFAYLEAQSSDMGERRSTGNRLKAGLATHSGLSPGEVAQALGIINSYMSGLPMSEAAERQLQFIVKLVDGSINVALYRAGVLVMPSESRKQSLFSKIRWPLTGLGAGTLLYVLLRRPPPPLQSADGTLPDPPAPPQ